MAVEVGLGKGDGGAFVAAGFEEVGAGGEGDGAVGFHEVAEGESGAHEEEWRKGLRSTRFILEEGCEVEFGIAEEEVGVIARIKMGEHVAEGRLGGFESRGGEEEGGENGEGPALRDGEFVEFGVGEVVGAADFGGGAGGEEGGFDGLAAGEGLVRKLEGTGGNGRDFLPICDGVRGGSEEVCEGAIGAVVLILMCKNSLGEFFKFTV